MKLASVVLLAVAVAEGAITNTQVVGVSNVQAVITYQSPIDGACTVEASEGLAGFTQLVHDVDPALFADSNSDSRFTTASNGRQRTFIIGQRAVGQASDQKWYSRALQTDTTHSYRIHCGDDTSTGTFHTTNIPGGATYPWPIPQDPKTGDFRWPSVDGADRTQTVIDPNYGTLIRRVTLPGDFPGLSFTKKRFSQVSATNWTGAGSLSPSASGVIRIHAGGGDYTDPDGNAWSADRGFSGGGTFTTTNAIRNTPTPALYQSERWSDQPFKYSFTVPNGNYTVTLKFAEIYFNQPGQRLFNVLLNGQPALTRFDIVAEAGASFTAVDRPFPVVVSDGRITIDFAPVLSNPKVNAIQILPQNAAPQGPAAPGAAVSTGATDWLIFTNPGITMSAAYIFGQAIDSVTVRVTGFGQGTAAEDRSIDVCLTIDGATCRGNIRTVVLDRSSSVQQLGGVDTWGAALWAQDVNGNGSFGVMIRPSKAGAPPISIQSAEMDVTMSEQAGFPDAGSFRTCAAVKSNGGFHCSYPGSGGNGYNYLFWIDPVSGDVRRLGGLIATNWGGPQTFCLSSNALFDSADPNVYYCEGLLNNHPVILKGTYTGNDNEAPPGAAAPMTWVNITPPGNGIGDLIKKFDPTFDPASFSCFLNDVFNSYGVIRCPTAGQDSIGWLAVLDLKKGVIVAAANTAAAPNTRWCGLHAVEPLDITLNWIGWNPSILFGNSPGRGPYSVTLQDSLPATGTATIHVSGEPTPYLMDAAAGDLFIVNTGKPGFELVRIVRKNSSTEWVVNHTAAFTTPTAHGAGEQLMAYCNAGPADDPTVGASVYWSFLEDPRAQDTTGQKWVPEKVLTGAHLAQRGAFRIESAYSVVTPGLPTSLNKPVTFQIPSNPKWAGQYVGVNGASLPNTYQSHSSYENYLAKEAGRNNWFVDLLPFIGGSNVTSSITPVPGSTQVYKVNGAALNRAVAPSFALCGGRQLLDVSPGPIQDSNPYSYCVGSGCSAGASAGDVFISCPQPVSKSSSCTGAFNGDDSAVCVSSLVPYGQSITQFFLDRTGPGDRVLTNGLFPWHSPRSAMILSTASPLPDGSWVAFPSYANNARRDIYLVKVPPPPQPSSLAMNDLMPQSVSVTAPNTTGIQQVLLQYGGTDQLGSSTVPVSCSPGAACPVSVSGRPEGILYVKPVYLDANGKTVAEGPVQVTVVGGVAGANLPAPKIAANGVLNAASLAPAIAPGGVVSIFGENLATCEAKPDSYPLPTTLCDSRVSFNGQSARYLYANPSLVNVLLPGITAVGQDVNVIASRESLDSAPFKVPGSAIQAVAPALYSYTSADGKVRAMVQNSDQTLNGPIADPPSTTRPMRLGESGVVFLNSLGATDPPVADGDAAPSEPPARPLAPVEVRVNGFPEPVLSANLSPQSAGSYQINFTLDPATPIQDGDNNYISVASGENQSQRLLISLTADPAADSPSAAARPLR
jgi:uncharacterized protein (TIGR03437 family)